MEPLSTRSWPRISFPSRFPSLSLLPSLDDSSTLAAPILSTSTTTMPDVVNWIFYYPHPDSVHDVVLVTTANPYSGHIANLWTLVKTKEPSLADHVTWRNTAHVLHRTYILFVHHRRLPEVTFLESESRRTQTGRTTTFCFLRGYVWASTLRKISFVSLELLQPLDVSSLTSGSSTRPPCRPQAALHICSPRLYRSLHRFRAISCHHGQTSHCRRGYSGVLVRGRPR